MKYNWIIRVNVMFNFWIYCSVHFKQLLLSNIAVYNISIYMVWFKQSSRCRLILRSVYFKNILFVIQLVDLLAIEYYCSYEIVFRICWMQCTNENLFVIYVWILGRHTFDDFSLVLFFIKCKIIKSYEMKISWVWLGT